MEITVGPKDAPPRRYSVRLHFAEPEVARPGRRVFRVSVEGEEVVDRLDLAEEAGTRTALVKTIHNVEVADVLHVALAPVGEEPEAEPVLCGIEVVAEGW